eukprot:TRINITY_DN142_c0_g1_i4.p1 TRINITY_DN142_c0_g1~~TRINITY_DN142_c0_g1_i4.p1  ORF type:complete len:356 (+),score=48.85 TRINITY_DN142_c0_g1_i4:305-1372(+)
MGNSSSAPPFAGNKDDIDPKNFPKHDIGETVVLSDGRKLGYMRYGKIDDTPKYNILLFPGIPGSRLFCPYHFIPDNVNIFVLERPGIGLSDEKPNRTFLDWANDVNEFVDKVGLSRFSVVGYSAGGPYGLVVASKLGELRDGNGKSRLAGVAIISSVSPKAPEVTAGMTMQFKFAYYLAEKYPSILRSIVKSMSKDFMKNPVKGGREDMGQYCKFDQEMYTTAKVETLFLQSGLEVHSRGQWKSEAYEYTLWCKDWGFKLEDIKTKCTVWQGELDTGTTLNMGKYISKRIQNSKFNIVPNTGHMLFFQIWPDVVDFLVSCFDENENANNESMEIKLTEKSSPVQNGASQETTIAL